MKVECYQSSVNSIQHDLEVAHSHLEEERKGRATCEKRLNEVHLRKISELTTSNDDLKAEIGKLHVCLCVFYNSVAHLLVLCCGV